VDSNGIIWTISIGTIGLLGLIAMILDHKKLARISPEGRGSELAVGALARESTGTERAESRAIQGKRQRLLEAKNTAEKAYAQRVMVAEREFIARKNRADVYLRAAEMFLEHAQEYGRGIRGPESTLEAYEPRIDFEGLPFALESGEDATENFFLNDRSTLIAPAVNPAARLIQGLEKGRSQRIRSAREHLADVMLEHHLVVSAAEKQFADAKAQGSDVLSATAALAAFDARNGKRDNNGAKPAAREQ
jgi:hypothetical protein